MRQPSVQLTHIKITIERTLTTAHYYVSLHPMFKEFLLHKVFDIIHRQAVEKSLRCYVVGGYVRDIILERPSWDVDVVVEGDGIELAEFVASQLSPKPKVSVFKNFGTAHFVYDHTEWEFVGARSESYRRNSRNPEVLPATIEEDMLRRDFTINAMAVSLGSDFGELLDPFDGQSDLKKGIIRTPRDPHITFSDDPLRMFRAVRFASRFDFKIDESAFNSIRDNVGRIGIVAPERISEELNKILMHKKPSAGFFLLDRCGLLQPVLPELSALKGVENMNGVMHKENFTHTLMVVDNVAAVSDSLWLRWAALLHDIGKAPTKKYDKTRGWTFHGHDAVGQRMVLKVFKRLHLPQNEKMNYVAKIVGLHLRPISLVEDGVTDSALRRLIFEAGDDLEDLLIHAEADITSANKQKVKLYLHNFTDLRTKLAETEEKDRIRNFQPPVSGEEIMEFFGLEPSREVGIIKNAIKDAILDGVIHNDRDEAWQLMLEKGRQLGLKPR
ncbi:Multifunctional CCA protein [bioreactor metagenome]|uniref:Multifunctional CCA protein n=1 Tax=bioreactor metagenome TaxID=1076179 RepID=A0A644WXK5_9ZZZZ